MPGCTATLARGRHVVPCGVRAVLSRDARFFCLEHAPLKFVREAIESKNHYMRSRDYHEALTRLKDEP